MADGDSGIEGELGNHNVDTPVEDTPQENGEEQTENHTSPSEEVVEDRTSNDDADGDRPVVELFVKVLLFVI